MLKYSSLTATLKGLRPPLTEPVVSSVLAPRLVDIWLNDYGRVTGDYEVVETKNEGFSYLFDISAERLIAAWGLSRGKDLSPRTIIATRMIPTGPKLTKFGTTDVKMKRIPSAESRLRTAVVATSTSCVSKLSPS